MKTLHEASASRPRRSASTWTTRRTASPARRSRSSSNWPSSPACGPASTPCSGGRRSTSPRSAPSCTWRCAPERAVHRRGRRGRRAGRPRRARPDGRLLRGGAGRGVDGAHRQAHPQRHQRRHRRLGPRPGDGLRGPQALQRPEPDLPVRLQRRRHRLRRSHPRPRPGGDAVHRLLEDLHDPRDDDQRPHGAAPGAWAPWGTRRRSPGTSSPSRRMPKR